MGRVVNMYDKTYKLITEYFIEPDLWLDSDNWRFRPNPRHALANDCEKLYDFVCNLITEKALKEIL